MAAVIEVEELGRRHGEAAAVDGVSFEVAEREIFGIVGPNGAGKTTTVEIMEGLRVPDAGRVRVLGLDRTATARGRASGSAPRCSRPPCPSGSRSGRRWTCTPPSTTGPPLAGAAGALGLAERRNAAVGNLSDGQRQRLQIALALIGRPEVVFLDELTTGLDPQARRDTWELVRAVRDDGATVVLVTHLMEEAERLCDRVAVIDRGRVVALDTPRAPGRPGRHGQPRRRLPAPDRKRSELTCDRSGS